MSNSYRVGAVPKAPLLRFRRSRLGIEGGTVSNVGSWIIKNRVFGIDYGMIMRGPGRENQW